MSQEQDKSDAELWRYFMKISTLKDGLLKIHIEGCTSEQLAKILFDDKAKAELTDS